MEIVRASLAFQIQNVLQVLYLLLELLDEGIVLGTDLVRANFRHDFFGSISEFKR